MAGYGLLIGINEYLYDEIPKLHGCINDIELAARMLQERFGFAADGIVSLSDEQATRAGIIREFEALISKVRPGDKAVIYYSGHGSRIPDKEGDEPDGFDDTIVPYDSGRLGHPNTDITDDEIYVFLRRLTDRTHHCTLVFDSCHSGGISRDGFGAAARSVEPDLRTQAQHDAAGSVERLLPPDMIAEIKTARAATRSGEISGWLPLYDKYVLIAGCRSDQRSYEYAVDTNSGITGQTFTERPIHGALSYFLWKTVSETSGRLSYRRLFEKLTPMVTATYAEQNPQIEGAVETELFGTERIQQRNDYLLVTNSDGLAVTLSAGAAQGVTVGSEYGLYSEGTTEITTDTPKLGRVKVRGVSAITSKADIVEGSAVTTGCYAFEEAHSYGEMRLKVAADSPNLIERIQKSGLLRVAEPGETADLRVQLLASRDAVGAGDAVPQLGPLSAPAWAVVGADGLVAMPPKSESDIETVFQNLEKIARYQFTLQLTNPAPQTLFGDIAEVRLKRKDASGSWIDAVPNPGSSVPTFYEGDQIGIEITSNHSSDIYAHLFDFGLTRRIGMLYPRGGMAQAIAPGGTLQVGMRDGEKIVLSLPKDYPYVVDPSAPASSGGVETFKVFITTEQADFRMLEQAAVRGGKEVRSDSRGLQRLLATASGGMILRDAMVFGEDTDWTTIETTFRLERKQQPISNTGVTVIGPVVKIEPHPALKGKARIAEVSSGGKDLGPGLPAGLSLLQLGPSGQARSLEPGAATPATVIELLEVEDASVVTRNAPLRITVQAPLSKQEVALPMGWDGEFLLPLGRLESRTGNSLTFALEHLPDPTASGEKSLFGSIKIFFQKTLSQALGWDYPYPRLDAPIIQLEENKVTYNNLPVDVLRSKVAAADRVVVFVHGIIGDTVGMALMAPHCGLPMDDPKTLILTFDYENLNTGIEATGRKLGEKLTAIGLTPDHGKKLFIVAHSMGGLVSRWFIEHEDGGLVVTRLITLGTPHLGSPWSKTIDMALFGLSLAFNKLGHAFWPAHLIGGLAAGVQKIDVMLDEMGVGSDFIKRLADTGSLPIPPVPYTLVCGNTTLIAAAQDAGKMEALFARLFSKNTLYSGLTPLFGGSPNDIAVNVASSRADTLPVSWQLDRHEVPSDHLIYFENPETCAIVRQAIS